MAEAERFDSNGNPVSGKKKRKIWLWILLALLVIVLLDSSLIHWTLSILRPETRAYSSSYLSCHSAGVQ